MAEPSPDHIVDSPPSSASVPRAERRRFLVQLGLLAGAGLIPFVGRGASAERGRPTRLETARPALGTWVRVVAVDGDESRAARGVERAFAAISLVDRQMSIHRADSQLARVNAAAGIRAVRVDAALLDVVARACDGSARTGGIYDPTVLPLMRLYGFYGASRERYPTDREISDALTRTGRELVVADRAAGTLGLTRRGAGLDLGSIGKGWALDRAIDALRAEGVASGLVDVGGNVYAMGVPDEQAAGWNIGVSHPVTGAVDRRFTLRDEAIATSGNSEQSHRLGKTLVGHLLDARGGRPANGPLSATVRARTGVDSDRCSTVAFLLGPGRFRGFPGAVEAHFIG